MFVRYKYYLPSSLLQNDLNNMTNTRFDNYDLPSSVVLINTE